MKASEILMWGKSYEVDQLVFEVEIVTAGTYDFVDLMFADAPPNYAYDFTIDYGDGSLIDAKSGSNIYSTTVNKTYALGTYRVTITGHIPGFGWDAGGHPTGLNLIRILNWGDFYCFSVPDESSLIEIPQKPLPDLYNDYYYFYLFRNTGITKIPYNLFYNQTDPNNGYFTQLNETFLNCPITEIPAGFFDFITTTLFPLGISLTDTFYGCTSIVNTIDDVWNNAAVAGHYRTFYGCVNAANYASIPNDWKGL